MTLLFGVYVTTEASKGSNWSIKSAKVFKALSSLRVASVRSVELAR